MTQSYILKHVLTCPIMGSHGYIFLWNDFGVVQIFHGRFWRHHKRQTSPHSIRRHAYFFQDCNTKRLDLFSSGLNFFHFNFLACLLTTPRRSDTYLFATPPNNASLKVEYTKITILNVSGRSELRFSDFRLFVDDFCPFFCSEDKVALYWNYLIHRSKNCL